MYLRDILENKLIDFLSSPHNQIFQGKLINLCNKKFFQKYGVSSAADLTDNILETKKFDYNKTALKRFLNLLLDKENILLVSQELKVNTADLLKLTYSAIKFFEKLDDPYSLNPFEQKVMNLFDKTTTKISNNTSENSASNNLNLNQLIITGKENGFLEYDQIKQILETDDYSFEQSQIIKIIEDLGIEIRKDSSIIDADNIQIIEYPDNEKYEGQILNDKRHGKGCYYFKDESIYDGEWVDDMMHGTGKYTTSSFTYLGQMEKNTIEGNGEITYKNGDTYKGQWSKNMKNGYGKCVYANRDIYKGNWVNNKREGKGYLNFSDGRIYSGNFKDDHIHGFGKMTYPKGLIKVYSGQFVYGARHGKGRVIYKNGDIFDGDFFNDKLGEG